MTAKYVIWVEDNRVRYRVSEGEMLRYIKKALNHKEFHKYDQIIDTVALTAQSNFGGQITQ